MPQITCPGVWLCPKGKVSVRVSMLDRSAETRDMEPAFPLLVHEAFTFSHTFRRVRYLQDLAHLLSGHLLSIQLVSTKLLTISLFGNVQGLQLKNNMLMCQFT